MGGLKEEEPPGPGLASANGGQQTLKGVTPIAEPAFWFHCAPVRQNHALPHTLILRPLYKPFLPAPHTGACKYGPWMKGLENRTLETQCRLWRENSARLGQYVYRLRLIWVRRRTRLKPVFNLRPG